MAERRRKRGTNSGDSDELSSESEPEDNNQKNQDNLSADKEELLEAEFHSAEEDGGTSESLKSFSSPEKNETKMEEKPKCEEKVSEKILTELIEEDGSGEGIAEPVEIEGEFLDDELLQVCENSSDVIYSMDVTDPELELQSCIKKLENEKLADELAATLVKDKLAESKDDKTQDKVNETNVSLEKENNINSKESIPKDKLEPKNVKADGDKYEDEYYEEEVINENYEEPEKESCNENYEEPSDAKYEEERDEKCEEPRNEMQEKETDERYKEETGNEKYDEEAGDDKYDEEAEDDKYDEECDDDDYTEEDDCEDEEEDCIDGDEGTYVVKEERQQGDGEECDPNAPDKELDFDEDRRNPQYIPKKGIFYEHDDRILESPKEKEVDTTRDKKKKKLWADDGKWGHDRYREDEQIPKSRNELIEVYGYDIRCEDGPPRARRRRRYGRGPSKYEPNWDENAPRKDQTLGMFIRRGSRGGRVRGQFRGGNSSFRGGNSSFRGTSRPYNKAENENNINNNNDNFSNVNKRKNFNTAPNKPLKKNVSGWDDDFPTINATKQNKPTNFTNANSPPVASYKEQKKENLCGWESDEEPITITRTIKNVDAKPENLSGWESDDNKKQTKAKKENLCGWESDEESSATKQTKPKTENICGWESDGGNHEENPSTNRNFASSKDITNRPSDNGSAFTRRKPIPRENQEPSSVRSQTFENSSFSNNRPPPSYSSYEKPPRHENLRGPARVSRRGARGRSSRGTERHFNNNDSYLKPSVGPRLLDKQMNRMNTDMEKLNLSNRNENYEDIESVNVYDQKSHGKMNRQNNNIGVSSNHEDSANPPKRYSHSRQRQRTLNETTNYQPSQNAVPPSHTPYYEAGYQQALYAADSVTPSPQPPSSGSPPVISPPQYQTYSPSPYPENYGLRVPVNSTARLYPTVTTVPAGQPINMTPPPCITPTANLINYATGPTTQPAYPPQYAYPQYPPPAQPPPPVSQPPPEMYRSGITYFYPPTQPQHRQVPHKRPKAAIPIVPPPENEIRGIERKDVTHLKESQHPDIDSELDGTDSSTLQAQVEVES